MHKTPSNLIRVILLGVAATLMSCQPDVETTHLSVVVRLRNEPDCLHPIFSKSDFATRIESLILLPAAEYDPASLTLSPLLLERIPDAEQVTSGNHEGGDVYRLAFRKEATWADGQPVTAEDYLFSIKSVYNPYVSAPSYRSFYDFLSEIIIDPADPKKAAVYMDSSYILALATVVNFNIYPAHIYDPDQIMSRFTLEDLRDPNHQWSTEQDSLLKQFAAGYESVKFLRETVIGSGAYELDQWATGEFIRLKRKADWWGDQIKDPPLLLQAYPQEITYRFILDGAAAEAAMKAGEIDIMTEVAPASFVNLQQDATWKDKFQFFTPAIMQINYLELNTRDSVLADKRIRKALAYTIDYDGIMKNVLMGYGERTTGPIHPDKAYYDESLRLVEQDLKKAQDLIREAGWADTNGNGIPDKKIGGKTQELQLNIKVTNKEEGNIISNIVKENAAKAGFDIQIEVVEPSQLSQDVRQFNFDITPMRVRPYPDVDDPYSNWHSQSDRPGGNNRSGFHSPALDSIIHEIRTADTKDELDLAYEQFQEILHEAQPAIYLYVPHERIIVSKRVEMTPSLLRPGYFENLFKPAGESASIP